MTRNNPRHGKKLMIASTAALVAAMTAIAFAIPAAAQNENSLSDFEVEFTADGLGFEITSEKGISHVVVEYCDGSTHKHEGALFEGEVKVWSHTEEQVILSVTVKAGTSEETFTNPNADCGEIPFFSTGTALILGTVGALGGAFLVMRRRK